MKGKSPSPFPVRIIVILVALALGIAHADIVIDDAAPDQPAEKGILPAEPTPKTPQPENVISFLNKDILHGALLSIDPAAGLQWQTPEVQSAIVFKQDNVSEITLNGSKPANAPASGEQVGLTNGDLLPGTIASLDDKSMVLDTWYAGRLTIPRTMVSKILPGSSTNYVLYQGPDSLDGWSQGRNNGMGMNMAGGQGRGWTYQDGALVGSNYATIGRDMNLTDSSSVAFDIDIRGNNQFAVGIYSDRPDSFGTCYMLQLGAGFVELRRSSRTVGVNDLGGSQIRNGLKPGKNRIELRTDKSKKSIWLMINGVVAKQWTDAADFDGGGGNVIFSSEPGSLVSISNIRATKWNGKFSDSSSNSGNEDVLQLANGDRVSGHVGGIADGAVKLSSTYADLSIPLTRVAEFYLASTSADQAKPAPGDIRVYLPEDGTVTMQLKKWDTKGCIGLSPNFGSATFIPGAFEKMLFNLPAQQKKTEVESSEGPFDSQGSD